MICVCDDPVVNKGGSQLSTVSVLQVKYLQRLQL